MTAKDIEQRLAQIAAGQQADPELLEAITRRDELQRQATTLDDQLAALRTVLLEHELAVEVALLDGGKIDDRAVGKTQGEISALESRTKLVARAVAEAHRRVMVCEQARAVRTEALLLPMFVDLVAQIDEQAEALAATEMLLALAHHAATQAIPSTYSTPLVEGYCSFVNGERLRWWRERVIRAGLLPAARTVA